KKKGSKKLKTKANKKLAVKRRKKKVLATPKGYHSVTPYLIMNNAAEAIEFYKKAFGAKEVLRLEPQMGRVTHAELQMGDAKIMLADEHPEMDARSPRAFGGTPVSIYLYVKDIDATIEQSLSAGARLIRPIENMFYGDRNGLIEDP